jgi:hypothetical protein
MNDILLTGFYRLYDKCISCGKKKSQNEHQRCQSCCKKGDRNKLYGKHISKKLRQKISKTLKLKYKEGIIINANKGQKFTKKHKQNLSKSHLGNKLTKNTIIKMKKALQKHHIDLNGLNNEKNNVMYLSLINHRKLHCWAYRYLVKIGKIYNYTKWFLKQVNKGGLNEENT